MILAALTVGNVIGDVEYHSSGSYIVRVYVDNRQLLNEVFGNGLAAEDRLLELLEFPEWTVLKYG